MVSKWLSKCNRLKRSAASKQSTTLSRHRPYVTMPKIMWTKAAWNPGKGSAWWLSPPFSYQPLPRSNCQHNTALVSVASPFKWKLLIIAGTVPTIFYVKVGLFKIAQKRTNQKVQLDLKRASYLACLGESLKGKKMVQAFLPQKNKKLFSFSCATFNTFIKYHTTIFVPNFAMTGIFH